MLNFIFSHPSGHNHNLRNRKRASLDSIDEKEKRQCIKDERQTSESQVDNMDTNIKIENGVESEASKNKPKSSNDKQILKQEKNGTQNPAKGNASVPSFADVAAGKNKSTTNQHNNEKSEFDSDNKRRKMEPLKQNFQESVSDDEIKVTFEVLLSDEMKIPNGKVRIVFGPPLSDWGTQMVEMKIKDGKENVKPRNYVFHNGIRVTSGNYTFLTGVLYLQKKLQTKSIPYKYIVETQSRTIWEHIEFGYNDGKEVNRCLFVPNQIVRNSFTKFDDVILGRRFFPPAHIFQRLGRETASLWMMPRPSELDNPNFDFEAALERFELVIKSHGDNGTSLCLDNEQCRKLNPVGYNVKEQINSCLENFSKRIDSYLKGDDMTKLLRSTLWYLLLAHQREFTVKNEVSLKILEAFERCQNALIDPEEQVTFLNNEISCSDFLNFALTTFKLCHDLAQSPLKQDWFKIVC